MTENIDYKALYELAKMENSRLVRINIELTEEFDKYKIRYGKKSSYENDMELIIEEANKQKIKKNKEKTAFNPYDNLWKQFSKYDDTFD